MNSRDGGRRAVFSSRFNFPMTPNRWTRALREARAEGRALLDLAVSNPTAAGLSWDAGTLAAALAAPEIARYDPNPRGSPAAREAVAAFYAETHGARVDPAEIHLTASTSEAYAWLLKLLCEPGDAVAMPVPSYPLIPFLCRMENTDTREYALIRDEARERWTPDFDSLARAADDPRVKAIFCVNPNNPTGSVFSAEERARLEAFARERGLPLVVDEVFLEYMRDGAAAESFATAEGGSVFVLGGLSKTAALPQIKAGWILTRGDADFRREATRRLDFVADTFLSVSTPAQAALPALLRDAPAVRERVRARLDANEARLAAWCARSRDLKLLRREGGWYGVVRLPRGVEEESLATDLLRREGVVAHPGYFYDLECAPAPHLVFSLLAPEAAFDAAFPRLDAALLRN